MAPRVTRCDDAAERVADEMQAFDAELAQKNAQRRGVIIGARLVRCERARTAVTRGVPCDDAKPVVEALQLVLPRPRRRTDAVQENERYPRALFQIGETRARARGGSHLEILSGYHQAARNRTFSGA